MPLTKKQIAAIARSLVKSLLISAIVFAVSFVLMTFSFQLGILFLLCYSSLMIVRSSRHALPLRWFTALLPGVASLFSFGVQLLLFSKDYNLAIPLLFFLAGLLPGWLLARSHRIFHKNGQVYARRTLRYVLVWILALLLTQGGALLGMYRVANYGLIASGFMASILVTLSVLLLRKYFNERGNVAPTLATPASASILFWLSVPILVFGVSPAARAAIAVSNADEAARYVLRAGDFSHRVKAQWTSWQEYVDTLGSGKERKEVDETLDSVRSGGQDIGSVSYFGKAEGKLHAGGKVFVIYNPAKSGLVVGAGYRAIYGLLKAWGKAGNLLFSGFSSMPEGRTRFITESCGQNCVSFAYQCGMFAMKDVGPWTVVLRYGLYQRKVDVNWPYVYESFGDPDPDDCFWYGVREDGLRMITKIGSRLSEIEYAYPPGVKPPTGPIASLLALIESLLKGTGKYSDAAIAAGLAIALIQLLSGAGLMAAISSAEAAAGDAMRAAKTAAGSKQRDRTPSDFEIPQNGLPPPPLIDPDSKQPLVVHDGRDSYGPGYEGGKHGDVWYGDQWVDRETAARWIQERKEQHIARNRQREEFLEYSAEQREREIAWRHQERLWYGYKYDRKTDTYSKPTPKDTGEWKPPEMEYDEATGKWRDPYAETGKFQPTRLEDEKGDVTHAKIPVGALLPGDPGSYFDPKDISPGELADAARRWYRVRKFGEEFEHVYPELDKRLNELNTAEQDAIDKYKDIVKHRRMALGSGDKWLQEKLDDVYKQAKDNLDRVQGAKRDLTQRITSGSKGGNQYRTYERKYRSEWTVEKVTDEGKKIVKEMFAPDVTWIKPFVKGAMEARQRLEFSHEDQPTLFHQHDGLVKAIGETHRLMEAAREAKDPEAFARLRQNLDMQKQGLKSVTAEMGQLQKNNLNWQKQAIAATGAISMAAQQVAGAMELQAQLANSAVNAVTAALKLGRPRMIPLDTTPEQRSSLYDLEMKSSSRVKGQSDADAPKAIGAGGPGPPDLPPQMAKEYAALKAALAAGDDVGANRCAARMAMSDYAKFKGMVDGGEIDLAIGKRALATHQRIVRVGTGKGIQRTNGMGHLMEETIVDPSGVQMTNKAVDRAFAPGSGMEPLKVKKTSIADGIDILEPKYPGDTDITVLTNNRHCLRKGLDPDAVQNLAARNIHDCINEEAASQLGANVGNYCKKTRVKVFEPGSPEEVTSYSANKMAGRVIDSSGDVLDQPSTLGKEMYSAKQQNIGDIVSRSKTGRAMDAADESIQIFKTRQELKGSRVNLDEQVDGAREIGKHVGRSQDKAVWNLDDIDGTEVKFQAKNGKQGFGETLEVAKKGDPAAIKKLVNSEYDGNYDSFYKDCQNTCNRVTKNRIDEGGKVWSEQADRLRDTGMLVDGDNVVSHSVAGKKRSTTLNPAEVPASTETMPEYLQRMGISHDEASRIRVQRAEEHAAVIMKGDDPDLTGVDLDPTRSQPARSAKATPGALPPKHIQQALDGLEGMQRVDREIREAWYWTSKGGSYDKPDSWDNFQRGLDLKVHEGKLTHQEIDAWWKFMNEQWGRSRVADPGAGLPGGTRVGGTPTPDSPSSGTGGTRSGPPDGSTPDGNV